MKTSRVALITGVTGQDGSYLSEFLLSRGYEVHGMIRRSSSDYRERIAHLEGKPRFHLHFGHLDDSRYIIQIMNKRPVNPPAKLRETVGEGNVTGNDSEDRIIKTLAFFGIEDNRVTLWGTGKPLREFLWSEDVADASVHVPLNV